MRKTYVLAVFMTAFGCRHGFTVSHYVDHRLKTAPRGALACYASLTYGLSDTLLARDQPLEPMWLVLDSLRDQADSSYAMAYIIFQHHRDRATAGRWRRVRDSLEIEELTSFPNGNWVLVDRGDSIVGRGIMVHDVGHTDSLGAFVPGRSEWRAHAKRVPCLGLS
jgi:hypothetical protein